jgi:hypothetical protein
MQKDLFKSYYGPLHGSDWLRSIDQEGRSIFSQIGRASANYGQSGGQALVKKRGREYMSEIGKRGALVTNLKKYFQREIEKESNEPD